MECRNATPFAFRKCHCFLLLFSNVGSEAALLSFFNLFETTWRSWRHCVTSCKGFGLLRTQLGQKEMKHDETSTINRKYLKWCSWRSWTMCLDVPWNSQLFPKHPKAPGARREISDGEERIPGLRDRSPSVWKHSHLNGVSLYGHSCAHVVHMS